MKPAIQTANIIDSYFKKLWEPKNQQQRMLPQAIGLKM